MGAKADAMSAYTSPDVVPQSQAAALFQNVDLQSTSSKDSKTMSMDWKRAQSELKKKRKLEQEAKSDRKYIGAGVSVHSKEDDKRGAKMSDRKNFAELLHKDELRIYGDRCPLGYEKVNL